MAVAGGVYYYTFKRADNIGDAGGTTKSQSVAEKLRASQADCARLGAEVAQLKRTIDEQRKQIGRPTPVPVAPPPTSTETGSTAVALPPPAPDPEPHVPVADDGLSATDAASGVTVSLEAAGMTVVATDQQGKRQWKVDLASPARSVTIQNGQVVLMFNTTVTMDLATGSRSP